MITITSIIGMNRFGLKYAQLLVSTQLNLVGAEMVAEELNSLVYKRHLLIYFTEKVGISDKSSGLFKNFHKI